MGFGSSIIARLGLDSRDFREGISSAQGHLAAFAKGALGAIGLTGISAAINNVINYADKIQDLSERYRVNAETLQRIGNVAETEGSSLEGFARSLNKLLISASAASGGNKTLLNDFAELGITVDDLRKLSPEDIMLKIGKGSMAAAPLVRVLGKTALELRPALKGITDGTLEMGGAIKAIDIKKLSEARDTLDRLRQRGTIATAGSVTDVDKVQRNVRNQLADIFGGGSQATVAAYRGIWAALTGDVHAYNEQLSITEKNQVRLFEAIKKELGIDSGARVDGKASLISAAAPEASKDKRLLLSLKDLAEKGPNWGQVGTEQGWHGWTGGRAASGTAQALYNADQARRVLDLEEQARRVNLTGISPTGESAENLYNRADTIRQSIAGFLKESDRGSIRTEMDSTTMAADIAIMRDEMQRE